MMPARFQEPPQKRRQEERHRETSAACHVVSNAQHEADTDAPPFEEIARRFSEPGLTTFLLDPHAKMPDMNLTRFEAADIAAYVGTLK